MRKRLVPAFIIVAVIIIAGLIVNIRLPAHLKRRVEHLLADRFHAKVTIARLSVSFLPLPGIVVDGVKLQNPSRADASSRSSASSRAPTSSRSLERSTMSRSSGLKGCGLRSPPGQCTSGNLIQAVDRSRNHKQRAKTISLS